jgi:Secretion system C-terminal sorting domain
MKISLLNSAQHIITTVFFTCFITYAELHAQAPGIAWQNTIGGNGNDFLRSIQQTPDGGYILGGFSSSNISGDKTENKKGGPDYWVVKLDASGNIQWEKTIGGNGADYLSSIQQTADGGYILGGYSNSNISGDKTENAQGDDDCWVVKLDASGNIQWQNTIGGDGFDYLFSLQQTADGGYILGGESFSNISGDKSENNQGGGDYWVVKLDTSGNIQWQNTIGGDTSESFKSLQQTADGGYILGGFSLSNISGDKTENCQGSHDYWVVKLDASGNIQWQNTIGGDNSDQLQSLQQTADGGYILGGFSSSNISGDKTEKWKGGNDYWVVKLDASGNIQWQNTIGGNGDDKLFTLQQTADGGYILGGDSDSNISGDKSENCQGYEDYWFVKLNASGNIQWQNTIGGNGSDLLYSIQQTADGGYILGGYSYSNISGDKTENCQGDADYWVVKLDAVSSVHLISDCCGGRLHLYPNPVNTDLNIDLSKMPGSAFSLRLHTLVGTLVYTRAAVPMPVGGIIELPVSDLPEGSYFLSISNESGESVTEKVVVMHKR